jgi:PAS domain S-box-containing protein
MRALTRLLSQYRVALSLTALAFLGSLLLAASGHQLPFVLFTAAVVVSSLQGGLRPGLLATCLSALALGVEYRFLSPVAQEQGGSLPLWLLFVFVGLLSSYLGEQCRRAAEAVQWVHATLSSVGDAVIFADAKGHVTFVNPAAHLLTGWKQEEAVGKPIEQVYRTLDEETRQAVENPATKVLRGGQNVVQSGVTLLISKSGTDKKHIDTRSSAIRNSNGEKIGVILTFHDVSERRRADRADRDQTEKELQQSRLLLTAAQEAQRQSEGHLAEQKRSEEGLQRLLSETQAQLQERGAELGRLAASLQESIHARQRVENTLRQTKQELQVSEGRAAELAKAKTSLHQEVQAHQQAEKELRARTEESLQECQARLEAAHVQAAAATAARDQAAASLQECLGRLQMLESRTVDLDRANLSLGEELRTRRQAEEKLRQDKEFIERIVQSSADGIFAYDRECHLTFWNATMERISGIDQKGAVGGSAMELFPLLRENGKDLLLLESLEGKKAVARTALFSAPGETRLFETSYAPLLGREGEVAGAVAVVREINESNLASEVTQEAAEVAPSNGQTNAQPSPITSRLIPLYAGDAVDWLSFN